MGGASNISISDTLIILEKVPTVAEILEIRSMFSPILPPELIDTIINEAKLWPCVTFQRDYGSDGHTVVATMTPPIHYDTHDCVALTPPLSDMIKDDFFTVRRVKFVIRSCDQGWSSEPTTGIYEGSWTWFEAKIVRPLVRVGSGTTMINPTMEQIELDLKFGAETCCQTVKNPYATGKDGVKVTDDHVVDGRGDTWTINHNRRANSTAWAHSVTWEWDEEYDAIGADRKLHDEGIGQGAGFVSALTRDDRICVVARARFPGWMNIVEHVTIFVYYSL